MQVRVTPPDFSSPEAYPEAGHVICVTGESGSGKSAALGHLLAEGQSGIDAFRELVVAQLCPYPSYTTRDRRPDETDQPYDHQFVTSEKFHKLQGLGSFLFEADVPFGKYGIPHFEQTFYPHQTEWNLPGPQVPIVIANNAVAALIEDVYPNTHTIEIVAHESARRSRQETRGDDPEAKRERYKIDKQDVETYQAGCQITSDIYAGEPKEFLIKVTADYLLARVAHIVDQQRRQASRLITTP